MPALKRGAQKVRNDRDLCRGADQYTSTTGAPQAQRSGILGLLRPPLKTQAGFTLLEVLVALVIVGVALGASLRAVGSLTQNSTHLRVTMMAMWSAENRLAQIRLSKTWPDIGRSTFPCPQDDLPLSCKQEVLATPNPSFRRVEVDVIDDRFPDQNLIKLTQVVPNAL